MPGSIHGQFVDCAEMTTVKNQVVWGFFIQYCREDKTTAAQFFPTTVLPLQTKITKIRNATSFPL